MSGFSAMRKPGNELPPISDSALAAKINPVFLPGSQRFLLCLLAGMSGRFSFAAFAAAQAPRPVCEFK
jgi:hypothetical protein